MQQECCGETGTSGPGRGRRRVWQEGEGEELCLTGKAQTPEVGDRRAASPRS